jgi:predicted metal-binding transcription factor (methanogenesis marker protein 9)
MLCVPTVACRGPPTCYSVPEHTQRLLSGSVPAHGHWRTCCCCLVRDCPVQVTAVTVSGQEPEEVYNNHNVLASRACLLYGTSQHNYCFGPNADLLLVLA